MQPPCFASPPAAVSRLSSAGPPMVVAMTVSTMMVELAQAETVTTHLAFGAAALFLHLFDRQRRVAGGGDQSPRRRVVGRRWERLAGVSHTGDRHRGFGEAAAFAV